MSRWDDWDYHKATTVHESQRDHYSPLLGPDGNHLRYDRPKMGFDLRRKAPEAQKQITVEDRPALPAPVEVITPIAMVNYYLGSSPYPMQTFAVTLSPDALSTTKKET